MKWDNTFTTILVITGTCRILDNTKKLMSSKKYGSVSCLFTF